MEDYKITKTEINDIDGIIEGLEYESRMRLKWFIDGYFNHCLGWRLFSQITTERICELYNVELTYFIKK